VERPRPPAGARRGSAARVVRIIAGRWRGRTIAAPPGQRTRPTTDRVRGAWRSALQHDLAEARVLDLFAGSGALGLETLSRGAAHVTFVERAQPVLQVLQANIRLLGAGADTEVVRGDAVKFALNLPPAAYDIVLADPPYDTDDAARLLDAFLHAPFARILCLEHRTGAALTLPEGALSKRYGDTTITFLTAPT
jgi:16S rRNA (guanine966-N2)-methyltransferase